MNINSMLNHFDSQYFCNFVTRDAKKEEKSQILKQTQILHKILPNIEIFVQALPPFTHRFSFPPRSSPRSYSPSILLPNPFPRLYGTRGFVSAILYRRPISIRIDPPGGAVFAEARHIFAGEHQSGQSVTKRFLIEPSLSYFIPSFSSFF